MTHRPEHRDPVSDDFDLHRFVDAQDSGGMFDQAGIELLSGRKESHWMWFIFPQIVGSGTVRWRSVMRFPDWLRRAPTCITGSSAHG